jgi:DNA-binding MarR family transcriptional regulator
MTVLTQKCAREILDVVPLVMRSLRADMRHYRAPGMSVPQLRTLVYLSGNEGASLSEVAEHIGLRLPSMSALIDGLVTRSLVVRQTSHSDRRRVTLSLTRAGRTALDEARRSTLGHLEERLAALPDAELATVVQAMCTLRSIMAPYYADPATR